MFIEQIKGFRGLSSEQLESINVEFPQWSQPMRKESHSGNLRAIHVGLGINFGSSPTALTVLTVLPANCALVCVCAACLSSIHIESNNNTEAATAQIHTHNGAIAVNAVGLLPEFMPKPTCMSETLKFASAWAKNS